MLISFISIFNKTRNIYRIKVYKKVFFFFIQEIAAPEIVRRIVFIAFDVIDGEFLTLTSDIEDGDYPEFEVSVALLAKVFACELKEVESTLLSKLPLKAEITAKEREIKDLTVVPSF